MCTEREQALFSYALVEEKENVCVLYRRNAERIAREQKGEMMLMLLIVWCRGILE